MPSYSRLDEHSVHRALMVAREFVAVRECLESLPLSLTCITLRNTRWRPPRGRGVLNARETETGERERERGKGSKRKGRSKASRAKEVQEILLVWLVKPMTPSRSC